MLPFGSHQAPLYTAIRGAYPEYSRPNGLRPGLHACPQRISGESLEQSCNFSRNTRLGSQFIFQIARQRSSHMSCVVGSTPTSVRASLSLTHTHTLSFSHTLSLVHPHTCHGRGGASGTCRNVPLSLSLSQTLSLARALSLSLSDTHTPSLSPSFILTHVMREGGNFPRNRPRGTPLGTPRAPAAALPARAGTGPKSTPPPVMVWD